MQSCQDLNIKRVISDADILHLKRTKLDCWRMNLMVVSEAHKYFIIAVEARLHVYQFDFSKLRYSDP